MTWDRSNLLQRAGSYRVVVVSVVLCCGHVLTMGDRIRADGTLSLRWIQFVAYHCVMWACSRLYVRYLITLLSATAVDGSTCLFVRSCLFVLLLMLITAWYLLDKFTKALKAHNFVSLLLSWIEEVFFAATSHHGSIWMNLSAYRVVLHGTVTTFCVKYYVHIAARQFCKLTVHLVKHCNSSCHH